jgi:cytoskeleton protein RodZ
VGELGSRLREAREKRGLSLSQVEESTRIRRAFLEALEEERFDDLPGDVYARGFIRNYAHFLGLEPEGLIGAYRKATGIAPTHIPQVLDQPLLHHSLRRAWVIALLVLVAIATLALAAWYAYGRFDIPTAFQGVIKSLQGPLATSVPSPLPTTRVPTLTQPTATPGMPSPQPTTEVRAIPTSTSTSSPTWTPERPTNTPIMTTTPVTSTSSVRATPTERATATPTITSTLVATPTSTLAQPTPGTGDIRVEGQVLAKTYLEVTADGQRIYTGLLDKGDTRSWAAQRTIMFLVGNAGGIKLIVNGVEAASLGAEGEVVTVTYNLDNLPRR